MKICGNICGHFLKNYSIASLPKWYIYNLEAKVQLNLIIYAFLDSTLAPNFKIYHFSKPAKKGAPIV